MKNLCPVINEINHYIEAMQPSIGPLLKISENYAEKVKHLRFKVSTKIIVTRVISSIGQMDFEAKPATTYVSL
jgi:hypothetical protein